MSSDSYIEEFQIEDIDGTGRYSQTILLIWNPSMNVDEVERHTSKEAMHVKCNPAKQLTENLKR